MKQNSLADFTNKVTSKELFNITINRITCVTLFGKVTVFPFVSVLKVVCLLLAKIQKVSDTTCKILKSREKKTTAQERPNHKHAASALRNRRRRGKRPDRDREGRLDAEHPRPPAGGCKCTPLSWILSMCRSSLGCGYRSPPQPT
jgi:hypothetical protein